MAEGLEQRIVLSSYPLHFDDSFLPYPGGASPFGVAADSIGDAFGVLSAGGPGGPPTIFEIAHSSSAVTPLATFSSAYDSDVNNLVADSSGDLFGTTSGTTPFVFEVAHGSSTITTLALFNAATGDFPNSRLTLDAGGDLFGTTYEGGSGGAGTVFELVHGGSTLTALATFNGANGALPNNVAVDSSGNVFGTVQYMVVNGVSNDGAVFEVAKGTGTVTTVATFSGTNGQSPEGGVALDSKGDLFGTASAGGTLGYGDVFEVLHGATTIQQIAPFNATNGAEPSGDVVVDAAGDVFGTTQNGGSLSVGAGTAFEVVSGSGVATALGSFSGPIGSNPNGVALDAAGDFFCATGAGGPATGDAGAIIEAPHGATAVTTLAAFASTNGDTPQSVVADSAGDLFGTTAAGGPNASGTVFEVSHATGTLTTLASFTPYNGEDPTYLYGNPYSGSYPAVVLDSAGDVYGVANTGGTIGAGSIFEVVHNSGTVTTLAAFDATDGDGPVSLAVDPAGDVFGVTAYGGDNETGTVFELPHNSGTITTLASFSSTTNGLPGDVALDAAGDLFGTANDGVDGFVFEVAHGSGAITPVASFNGANGTGPQGATADAAGDLFGTTSSGGNLGNGTVFEMAHGSGAITSLASFDGVTEQNPQGAVSIDASGDVFGDTAGGSNNSDGTVFEVAHNSGGVTSLLSFSGSNGLSPAFGVVADGSNDLYGITSQGGFAGAGAAFELSPVAATELAFASQPVNTRVGVTLTPPVTIDLEDSASNLATTNTSTVTLAIKSGPAGASIGTPTAVAANGIATFSNLSFATPGAYTLIVTDGTLASAISVSFTVAGAPAAVVIDNGNGQSAAAGTAFPIPLSVQVTDSLGNPVPGVAVTFSAPDGAPGPSGTFAGAPGDGTSISVQTNSSGVASSPTLICNTVPGSFNVTAAIGSISTIFSLNIAGPPAVLSVTPQDSAGNGVAAGSITAGVNTSGQRSMETQIAVVFSEPVNLTAGAFTLAQVNNYGSGSNDGSPNTDASAVLGTPTNPSGDGVTWIIPIIQNGASTTYSYNLSNGTTSLQDGIYQLGVNAANVTATGGVAMASNFTSPMFHRLFGDLQNTDNLNNFDLADLSRGFRSVSNLSPDLDFNGNGQADNLDLGAFRRNFGKSFSGPLGT